VCDRPGPLDADIEAPNHGGVAIRRCNSVTPGPERLSKPTGVTDSDMVRALEDRDRALEQRARFLAEQAVARGHSWTQVLGPVPTDPAQRERWFAGVSTVAAYRKRWGVRGEDTLGPDTTSIEQIGHRKRAQEAIDRATAVGHWSPVEARSGLEVVQVAEAGVTL